MHEHVCACVRGAGGDSATSWCTHCTTVGCPSLRLAAMEHFAQFATGHGDVIHDVAYDYYGRRLATCASDQQVKVWARDEEGRWRCQSSWKAHNAAVWKIAWAHPEFGQVLASCSFDRSVVIWEEQEGPLAPDGSTPVHWVSRAQLADARDAVTDMRFAPHHQGLRLATASADGLIRVYEAADPSSLAEWTVQVQFTAFAAAGGARAGVTCLAWNHSRLDPPQLVAAASDGAVRVWQQAGAAPQWAQVAQLTGAAAGQTVHDVAWAPSLGRSTHLIAAACKDRCVRVWQVHLAQRGGEAREARAPQKLREHQAEVWRVHWNVTGTVLYSSADDGAVRAWRRDREGRWRVVAEVFPAEDGLVGDSAVGGGDQEDALARFGLAPRQPVPSEQQGGGGVVGGDVEQLLLSAHALS